MINDLSEPIQSTMSSTEISFLREKLAKVESELYEMSTASYSQSNPGHVMGLRSLRRIRDRLVEQIKKLDPGSQK